MNQKIYTLSKLVIKRYYWKFKDKKVVFTNGCFDILHLGHVTYLEEAKKLGKVLIVGINSDESVKNLKGETRPINSELARAKIIASLNCVDAVLIFNEPTPLEIITELIPDILVKGGDYLPENIVGNEIVVENGGKVLALPFVEGYSTTRLIEKLKNN